jgi:hypothetical protein
MRLKGDNALMSSAPESRDQQYLSLILQKREVSKVYKPRFGQAREISLDEFRMLYGMMLSTHGSSSTTLLYTLLTRLLGA